MICKQGFTQFFHLVAYMITYSNICSQNIYHQFMALNCQIGLEEAMNKTISKVGNVNEKTFSMKPGAGKLLDFQTLE